MMGIRQAQKDLFSYNIDLDKRVGKGNPLRAIFERIDFSFVRQEVAGLYGYNGNVSEDPAVILKMMFLLFFDDIASERELMRIIAERLDYLWFLGYRLEDEIPDHSVLSKARKRWGKDVFQRFFIQIVGQCVTAGLVDGKKIHMDGSLIDANASKGSILEGSPELIAALKAAYEAVESKLEEEAPRPSDYERENKRLVSTSDPDAAVVRRGKMESRPRYKNHRVIDDAHGVITAVETTSGDVEENAKLMDLVEQHEANTEIKVAAVIADKQYGTAENFRACHERGIRSHMADLQAARKGTGRSSGIYTDTDFVYDTGSDTYRCPAGQILTMRKHKKKRKAFEYAAARMVCRTCDLRLKCTRAACGAARTLKRHYNQEAIDAAKRESQSQEAKRDRVKRKWMVEGSFADAANNFGFKRSRWRRLWRQRIQDYLIAAIQNVRILISRSERCKNAAIIAVVQPISRIYSAVLITIGGLFAYIRDLRCFWFLRRRLLSKPVFV